MKRWIVPGALVCTCLFAVGCSPSDNASTPSKEELTKDMIFIPGGTARIGSTPSEMDEAVTLCEAYAVTCDRERFTHETDKTVTVAPFYIDRYEYPNRKGEMPRAQVSWNEAKRLCEGQGKRLLTEEEWEFVARGAERRAFPWGNEWDPKACNCGHDRDAENRLLPSGSIEKCKTPAGVYDLAGSVWEWTASAYNEHNRTVKGGSWGIGPPSDCRAATRRAEIPVMRTKDIGFRCAMDGP